MAGPHSPTHSLPPICGGHGPCRQSPCWAWEHQGSAANLLAELQFLLSAGPPSPGRCLPLEGREGHVDLRLRTPIVPGALTLEHIPSSIAFNPGSAPRDLRLLALPQGVTRGTHLLSSELPVLGSFSYNGKAPGAVQTFNLSTSLEVQDVRLQVRGGAACCTECQLISATVYAA